MNRKYDIQLNLSPYANYFLGGGDTGGMTYTPEDNGFIRGSFSTEWTPQGISPSDAVLSKYQQSMVNSAERKQAIHEVAQKFLDSMNNSGGGGWTAAIAPAATNMANAFLDTEASTADRVAMAMGIPVLAKQWKADTSKGDSYLKDMTSTLDSMNGKNYIQDASSTFGANNAVKLNNKQIISPISAASGLPSLEDFKGNWWRNTGASMFQGAAAGSVGGPWGALGGAVTGLLGSIGGLFGRKGRAEKAYNDFLHKRDTLMSAQQNAFNTAVKNQTLSNMQALANGNMSQRINDMANIRAFGGNLFANGGSYIDPDPDTQDLMTSLDNPSLTADDIQRARLDAYYPNRLSDTFLGKPVGYLSEDAGLESYAPIIGTVQDWDKFVAEPTVGNAVWAGLSTIGDIPWLKMGGIGLRVLKRGWDAYNTYRKVAKALDKTKAVGNAGEAADALRNLRKVMPDPEYTQMRRQIIAPTRDKDVIEGVKDYYKHEGAKLASQLGREFKKPLTYADFAVNFAQDQIGGGDNYIPEDNKILSNNGVVFSYNPSSRTWISENSGAKGEKIVVPAEEMQQNLQNGLGKIINNNTGYAMGGNLYTDLSPNMMSLWNNKQQIDQQKTMNQQFSLGLGNSSFVNKFETGGPVDPPKEFMDRYHPDWGEYTPEYANLNYDDFMNVYWNGFGDEGDYLKYNPSEYNRYKYRKYLNYPNKNTLQNSYLFQPTYEELDKKYDDSDLPIYQGKDGQYYLKSGIGYNNIGNTNEDLVKWMGSNYDEYSRKVNAANGDIRLGLTKDEYDKYVLNRNDGNKRIEASKYDPKKHKGYIPVQDYNDWYADEINRVKHELKSRAFTNEFYAGQEVADYNARNINSAPYTPNEKALRARQRKQEIEEQARRTTTAIPSSKSSVNKVNKATTVANKQNSSPINNMTFQQMEDYYGQKQSPLLNAQYKNTWANGGQMTSADVPNNMQYYANGGTHEENPYGGIQVGTDQQGTPNLTEEGEFRWNDFVFSDRINVDANLLSSFNLAPATKHQNKKAAKGKLSYADMAKKYAKRNKELENDPITKNSMEAFMQRLANAQEYQKKAEQLEAQKQNELQDYKTALNKQNNNPMYGTMKYNGMGNAAAQQGVNSGVDAGMGNPMSNADLSNVNRSGNEMMAAYGGNLFAIGGKDDPNPYEWTLDNLNARQVLTPWNGNFIGPTLGDNTNLGNTPHTDSYSWGNIDANTPFYQNEGWGIDMKPTYMRVKNPNYNAPAVSTYASRDKNGKIVYDPNGKPFMSYPRTYEGMKSSDYPNTKVIGKTVDNYGFYLPNALSESSVTTPVTVPENSDNLARLNGNNYIPIASNGVSPVGVPQTGNTGTTYTQNLTGNGDVSNKVIDKTTSNTNPDAAVPSDYSEPPLYSTAGKYAQFGKGIMPMVWDWANKTNVKYDPYYRDADRLEALANEGPALRTADTIGGYRAPNLMDVERLNNSARAEGLAQMQAILDAANGNRGFVGAKSAQNNYNTQMGIGDNYVKTQEANNANRLQTDQFNHGINVANQNAINTMRQDNQRAEQTQHQLALSGTAQAAALRQRENLHADEVNTERMKNRATNQAAAVDNALNYFTTQAMENQELNTRNNDPTNPYWIDKNGVTHYTGDSGLTQAIRNEFGDDEYVRNGTFTGERLTEWNNLTKKYKAKDLKEHPELWRHLVAQQREANKIDADKAKQAKLEELEALRGTYQSNLARLDALRNSGAIVSDPSYNLYAGWADEDYSGNQGLLRNRNQALDQYITQIGNNYDRYLYEKQLAQNQAKALGGYLNAGQNNNNNYYSYTRI